VTLPGNTLTREDNRPPVGPNLTLATPMVVCETERAPAGVHRIRSMRDYARICGARTLDTAAGYDWLDGHFHEDGGAVLLTPLRGAAAQSASATVADAAAAVAGTFTFQVPSAYGDRVSLDIDAGGTAGTFIARILIDGAVVRTSPELADNVALQAWAAGPLGGGYGNYRPGAGGDPVPTAAPVALTGGDDDFDGITVTQIAAALARFTPSYGPGGFVLPGRTSAASHFAVADALVAAKINRVGHLAMPDVDAATIAAQAAAITDHNAADMIDLIAGRQIVPGLTADTTRTIDLTALRTGRQAANDAGGVSPNQPAAGTYGEATWATGLTQRGSSEPWTDEERELLYDAGVNVAKVVDGRIRLYGSRTAVSPDRNPAGFRLGSARLRMALTELLRYRVEQIQFHELDAAGIRINELQGQIEADIDQYPTSIHAYRVVSAVEAGETPGTAVLYAAIEDLQVSYDAEVIRAAISRTVTEV